MIWSGPLRRTLQPAIVPALGVCLLGYFAYHTVQGDHGLIARSHLKLEVAEAKEVLEDLRERRQYLEHRADLLNPEHLDLDMLDERLRAVLNYTHPDEVVVYTGK